MKKKTILKTLHVCYANYTDEFLKSGASLEYHLKAQVKMFQCSEEGRWITENCQVLEPILTKMRHRSKYHFYNVSVSVDVLFDDDQFLMYLLKYGPSRIMTKGSHGKK